MQQNLAHSKTEKKTTGSKRPFPFSCDTEFDSAPLSACSELPSLPFTFMYGSGLPLQNQMQLSPLLVHHALWCQQVAAASAASTSTDSLSMEKKEEKDSSKQNNDPINLSVTNNSEDGERHAVKEEDGDVVLDLSLNNR
jgi:hypothetical protein